MATPAEETRAQRQGETRRMQQIVSELTGKPIGEIGNYTVIGPNIPMVMTAIELEFKRQPQIDPTHPPTETTNFSELVGMFIR